MVFSSSSITIVVITMGVFDTFSRCVAYLWECCEDTATFAMGWLLGSEGIAFRFARESGRGLVDFGSVSSVGGRFPEGGMEYFSRVGTLRFDDSFFLFFALGGGGSLKVPLLDVGKFRSSDSVPL